MDRLKELLANLKTALGEYIKAGTADDQVRQREVLDFIRQNYHTEVWQPIANVGFAAGKAEAQGGIQTLTAERDGLKAQLQEAERKVGELSNKNTDVAAIQREAAEKVEKAEKKAREAKEEAKKTIRSAFQSRDVATFVSTLVAGGMDEELAEAKGVLLERRMDYDDAGVLKVFQLDSSTGLPGTIPYTITGQELLKVLAKEALDKAKPTQLRSNVDVGGGAGGERGQAGGGGTKDTYRQIQEDEKAKQEAERKRREDAGSIADRYHAGSGLARRS